MGLKRKGFWSKLEPLRTVRKSELRLNGKKIITL